MSDESAYAAIIWKIFERFYADGVLDFEFDRSEISEAATSLGLPPPKNFGDLTYSFRYRKDLPERIRRTAVDGLEWVIEPAGIAKYRFRLMRIHRIIPQESLLAIKIPDATPEIITRFAQGDEQALLAKVRYNRLVDIFLGITTYSLQNHLRTTVKGIGQIEIDEIYVGVNRTGHQFVIPVQAKGGNDQLAATQTRQDIACCKEKFENLTCRPVSAQFMADGGIAMFELTIQEEQVRIVDEKHYQLVRTSQITKEELQGYSER